MIKLKECPKGGGGERQESSSPSTSSCPPEFIVLCSLFSKV